MPQQQTCANLAKITQGGDLCWAEDNLEVELEASAELGSSGEVQRIEVRAEGHLDAVAEVLKDICK